jgi:hypothetical protein
LRKAGKISIWDEKIIFGIFPQKSKDPLFYSKNVVIIL